MAPLTYPPTFAQTIWLPFPESSSIGSLIVRSSSTIAEFLANRCNWISASGVVYDESEMASLWEMIDQQKLRVQAFWLVNQGEFFAIDPAMHSLR